MNSVLFIGVLLLVSLIPLGQMSISGYMQFTVYQKQAELEEMQCANTPCIGERPNAFEVPREYFEKSMLYLLAAFMIGGVGLVLVGLNRKELF